MNKMEIIKRLETSLDVTREIKNYMVFKRKQAQAFIKEIEAIEKMDLLPEQAKVLKERAFAKAQDASKKSLGAEIELGRRFKQMEKSPGERTDLKDEPLGLKAKRLEEWGFKLWEASEAERMHTHKEKIGEMVDEKDEKEEIVLRRDALRIITRPHITYSSGENEWYTPKIYIDAVRAVMGDIDVDPASSEIANRIIGAKIFYTAKDDGLTKPWSGRVWMNPPYSQPLIVKFSEAFVKKYGDGEITEGCVLINNATDTSWLQMMLEICNKICFIKGRIRFIDMDGNATGAPLQGQLILYFGKNTQKFNLKFSGFGIVK